MALHYLFVSELFGVMHHLGLTQAAVARHLGIGPSSVGEWSAGTRAVPKRHVEALLTLARATLATASAQAWAANHDPNRPPQLLRVPTSAQAFDAEVGDRLRRWELELAHTTGRLDATYAQQSAVLQFYAHLPLSKLARAELHEVQHALREMLWAARALAHLARDEAGTEGRLLRGPARLSPVEYFDDLVAWWRSMQRNGAEEEVDTA